MLLPWMLRGSYKINVKNNVFTLQHFPQAQEIRHEWDQLLVASHAFAVVLPAAILPSWLVSSSAKIVFITSCMKRTGLNDLRARLMNIWLHRACGRTNAVFRVSSILLLKIAAEQAAVRGSFIAVLKKKIDKRRSQWLLSESPPVWALGMKKRRRRRRTTPHVNQITRCLRACLFTF